MQYMNFMYLDITKSESTTEKLKMASKMYTKVQKMSYFPNHS